MKEVKKGSVASMTRTALIAAAYAAITLIIMQLLSVLSWGPVQLRVSEALTVLPLFFVQAIPGLAIGCALANVINASLTGAGALGMLDVVFGTLASILGAIWTYKFRHKHISFALIGPVLFNALIVPAYLPIIMSSVGFLEFYTIPFTSIDMSSSFIIMYLFGVVFVGIGQAIVVYGLGLPLARVLRSIIAKQNTQEVI